MTEGAYVRKLVMLVSIIASITFGYYTYSFNMIIQQQNDQITILQDDARNKEGEIANKNNEIAALSKKVSDGVSRVFNKDIQINKLTNSLNAVMCRHTIDASLLSGKYLRNQVGRVIQTWFEDNYSAVINNVAYSDKIYSNKNDFRMTIYYTEKNDNKRYIEVFTISYKLQQSDSSYQPENDSVRLISWDCVAYASGL